MFSLSPGERVLLFTIILMSVRVAGGAGADLPPERADVGRGSYEMVDILAIANGWSTVRETLQRDRAVQSPYIRCYEINSPCRVPCWSVVRDIARARRCNKREYPRLRLTTPVVIPLLANPPRALNINRLAAERSAARGASHSSSHLTSQPTADDEYVRDFSRQRSQRGAIRRPRRETASLPIPSK